MNYEREKQKLVAATAAKLAEIATLTAARDAAIAEMRAHLTRSTAVLNGAERENRALNDTETQQLADLDAKQAALEPEIHRLRTAADTAQAEYLKMPSSVALRTGLDIQDQGDSMTTKSEATGERWLDLKTGREIRALRSHERMRDHMDLAPEDQGLSLGRFLRGLVTGKWYGAEAEQRAMTIGSFAGGGALVPAPLSAELIDRARAQSVVFRMGAQTIPMTSTTLDIARITGDPTAVWQASELPTLTSSQGTFGRFTLRAKTLTMYETLSIELAEDAPNIETVLTDQITKCMALALDKAVLFGIPLEGYSGLRDWIPNDSANSLNETSQGTNGAALTSYAPIITAVKQVLEGNYAGPLEQLGIVMAPRTWATLEGLTEATTNAPLQPPPIYGKLNKLVSTQLPIDETQGSANTASTILLGSFSQVYVGVRTDTRIEVSREAEMFNRMGVAIRAYLRADWTVVNPKHLSRIIGIIP